MDAKLPLGSCHECNKNTMHELQDYREKNDKML
jgi:hypothetical protein